MDLSSGSWRDPGACLPPSPHFADEDAGAQGGWMTHSRSYCQLVEVLAHGNGSKYVILKLGRNQEQKRTDDLQWQQSFQPIYAASPASSLVLNSQKIHIVVIFPSSGLLGGRGLERSSRADGNEYTRVLRLWQAIAGLRKSWFSSGLGDSWQGGLLV